MYKKLLIVLFVIITMFSFSACTKKNSSNLIDESSGKQVDKPSVESKLIGKWASEQGTLFEFTKDGRYGYYKNKSNTSDYYYKGPLTVLNGQNALDDLGIDNEEYNRSIKKLAGSKDNVYSLKLHMEVLHSEGKDKSSSLDKKGYYYFAFYLLPDNNKAIMVNMNDVSNMEVTRQK